MTYEELMETLNCINGNSYVGHKTIMEWAIDTNNLQIVDVVFARVGFEYFCKYIKNIKCPEILSHVLNTHVANVELFCMVDDVLCKEDSILTKMPIELAYVILDYLRDYQLFSLSMIHIMDVNPDKFVNYLIRRGIDIFECNCELQNGKCECIWLLKNILYKCSFDLFQSLFIEGNAFDSELICFITCDLPKKLDYLHATGDILTPKSLKKLLDNEMYANIVIIVLKYPHLIEEYREILCSNMFKFRSLTLLRALNAPESYINLTMYEYSGDISLLPSILNDPNLATYMQSRKMLSDICTYASGDKFTKQSIDINNVYHLFYKFDVHSELYKHCYEHISRYGTFKLFRKIEKYGSGYLSEEVNDIRKELYHIKLKEFRNLYVMCKIYIGRSLGYASRRFMKRMGASFMISIFLAAINVKNYKVAHFAMSFIDYNSITEEHIMAAIKYIARPRLLHKFIVNAPPEVTTSEIVVEYARLMGDYMALSNIMTIKMQ